MPLFELRFTLPPSLLLCLSPLTSLNPTPSLAFILPHLPLLFLLLSQFFLLMSPTATAPLVYSCSPSSLSSLPSPFLFLASTASYLKGKDPITVSPLCLRVNPHPGLQACRWKVRVCGYPVYAALGPPAVWCSLGNNISTLEMIRNNDQTNTPTQTATHTRPECFYKYQNGFCTLIRCSYTLLHIILQSFEGEHVCLMCTFYVCQDAGSV